MDRPLITENSQAWMACVWISFAASISSMALGIYNLPAEFWIKGYMAMGLLFCVGSCFSLAKTTRDNHEARKLINRVTEVKTERMLHDYELKDVGR